MNTKEIEAELKNLVGKRFHKETLRIHLREVFKQTKEIKLKSNNENNLVEYSFVGKLIIHTKKYPIEINYLFLFGKFGRVGVFHDILITNAVLTEN